MTGRPRASLDGVRKLDASPGQVRSDFDRIAAAGAPPGGDHSTPVVEALLGRLPARIERALDLGCGAGDLLVRLAPRCAVLTGIDLSPGMVARARARTAALANVEIRVADFMDAELPAGAFDLVISVATFHHLPLAPALARAAALVAPGGRLAVVDLFEPAGPGGFLYDASSWLLARWRDRGRPAPAPELRDAWRAHEEHDRIPSLSEVRSAARALPGARVTVHPLWRWSLEWERPLA